MDNKYELHIQKLQDWYKILILIKIPLLTQKSLEHFLADAPTSGETIPGNFGCVQLFILRVLTVILGEHMSQ